MTALAVRHRGEMGGIASADDLDQAIKIIGLCDIQLDRIDQDLDLEIKKLKAAALLKASEVKADRAVLLAAAETYVATHKDEVLKGKKTASMNFGKTGYRRRPAVIPLPLRGTSEMEALCDAIEAAQAEFNGNFEQVAIIIRRHVEQSTIKMLADDELGLLELTRKPAWEEFFVQPNREKLAEVANV